MQAFLFFNAYDLIALVPTKHNTFSSACLTHSLPSQVTAHIISLLLTPPSLPYHIKHNLIKLPLRTVPFWDLLLWSSWGREQLYPRWNRCWGKRAECETKLVGFLLGVSSCNKRKEYRRKRWNFNEADLRSLRDLDWLEIQHEMPRAKFRNLLSFEFVSDFFFYFVSATDLGYHRRKTYRAVLSEPKIVFPANSDLAESSNPTENREMLDIVAADRPQIQKRRREESRHSRKKNKRQNQVGVEAVIWCVLYLLINFYSYPIF